MFDDAQRRAPEDKIPTGPYRAHMAPLPTQVVADVLRSRIPGVDTLKLHKLLYYCQGHHLAAFEQQLFSDTIYAFDNGPLVSRFWWAERNGEPSTPGNRELTEAELNTIGYVISRYGHMSGNDLIRRTHDEAPWQRADEDRPPKGSVRIEEEWMQSYFRDVAAEVDPQALRRSPIAEKLAANLHVDHPSASEMDNPDSIREKLRELRRSTG